MNKQLRICTWNVCLGLKYKLNYVKELLLKNAIDILCIQEAEIRADDNISVLEIPEYNIELENVTGLNTIRTVVYIRSSIHYRRHHDLEKSNTHIILMTCQDLGIASLYRTYKLTENNSHQAAFEEQMGVLSPFFALHKNYITLGDFNLDENRRDENSYHHAQLYSKWKEFEDDHQLVQLVNFNTWCRRVQGQLQQSCLDHVYTNCVDIVEEVDELSISISDHVPVMAILGISNQQYHKKIWVRQWQNYSKEELLLRLREHDWNITCTEVDDYNDDMLQKLMTVAHQVCPFEEITIRNGRFKETKKLTAMKKRRKNLFANAKKRNNARLLRRCKKLDKKIRRLSSESLSSRVRSKVERGGQQGLWQGVRLAHDQKMSSIPDKMEANGNLLTTPQQKADAFATFFKEKIVNITSTVTIDPQINNGDRLIASTSNNFFSYEKVKKELETLRDKPSYGFDNVPVKLLKDGAEILALPMHKLMNLIYYQKRVPELWKTSRIIPLFKKGKKSQIENYRPISNLCASSKVFERLVLTRILDIEKEARVDIFGKTQHGFRKGRSTVTAAIELQACLAESMDNNHYVAVASLDLSAAFDVINIELLMKRLEKIGIPRDLLEILNSWLTERVAYVEVSGVCSSYIKVDCGTVQGSILGPVLFNLFISPLIRAEKLLAYADDNYPIGIGITKDAALADLQRRVIIAEKWMSGSGLKVNLQKTELCIFHRHDSGKGQLTVNSVVIKSGNCLNVLGIKYDSRLDWSLQVDKSISEARKATQAIRMIKSHFWGHELLKLITSFVYSRLYYAAQVWLLPTLKQNLQKRLFSQSGNSLKLIENEPTFTQLHKKYNRATPYIYSLYLSSLNLYDLNYNRVPVQDYANLQTVTMNSRRNLKLVFIRNNKYKVGLNRISNRMRSITNVVNKSWMNLSRNSFKKLCKDNIIGLKLHDL
jgi:hypothetical protein